MSEAQQQERNSTVMLRAWKSCEEFNENIQVGTPVKYTPTDRGPRNTITTTEASALPGGRAVVGVEGVSFLVDLDQIQRLDRLGDSK